MTSELVALLDGREVGRVRNDARGRLTLLIQRLAPGRGTYPLSLSMPLAAEEHGPSSVQAFLWGLLPDNERVLERWAPKFQVSAPTCLPLFPMSARTAQVPSSSSRPIGWRSCEAVPKTRSNGLTRRRSPNACKHCVRTMPHGGCRAIPDNSALQVPNPKLRASAKGQVGNSLRAHSDDPYPQTTDRPFRRTCGKRAYLPHARPKSRFTGRRHQSNALRKGNRHRHRAL